MPDTQPLPSPGEIAAMDGHLLRDWSVQAMGWKSISRGQVWLYEAPDGSVRNEWDWHPEKDANQAIELAEKVFEDEGFGTFMTQGGKHRTKYMAQDGSRDPRGWGPTFPLALCRAAVLAWAEREREAQR